MKLFDKNEDGRISRAEYAETVSKISPKDKELKRLFIYIFKKFITQADRQFNI